MIAYEERDDERLTPLTERIVEEDIDITSAQQARSETRRLVERVKQYRRSKGRLPDCDDE